MVFGGRKFKKWKEENPQGIYDAFIRSKGSSSQIESLLNDATNNECRKQIREFIKDSEELGFLNLLDTN